MVSKINQNSSIAADQERTFTKTDFEFLKEIR